MDKGRDSLAYTRWKCSSPRAAKCNLFPVSSLGLLGICILTTGGPASCPQQLEPLAGRLDRAEGLGRYPLAPHLQNPAELSHQRPG